MTADRQTLPSGWRVEVEENDPNSFFRLVGPGDSVTFPAERGSVRAMFFQDFAVALADGVRVLYSFRCYSCAHEWEATTPTADCPAAGCGTTNDHCAANPEPTPGVREDDRG